MKNWAQSLIISNFLLAQTPAKLKNPNIFHVFVQIFEMHVIQKIYPKYMDPVTSTGLEKFLGTYFSGFLKCERAFSYIRIK